MYHFKRDILKWTKFICISHLAFIVRWFFVWEGSTVGNSAEELLSGIADNTLRNITGVNDTPQEMDWGATINDALFAMKTSGYLGSMGNMNLSNDITVNTNVDTALTGENSGGIVNANFTFSNIGIKFLSLHIN